MFAELFTGFFFRENPLYSMYDWNKQSNEAEKVLTSGIANNV